MQTMLMRGSVSLFSDNFPGENILMSAYSHWLQVLIKFWFSNKTVCQKQVIRPTSVEQWVVHGSPELANLQYVCTGFYTYVELFKAFFSQLSVQRSHSIINQWQRCIYCVGFQENVNCPWLLSNYSYISIVLSIIVLILFFPEKKRRT